jgi:hypothetical protein
MIDVAREQGLMREGALGVGPAFALIAPGTDLGRKVTFTDPGTGLDLAMVKRFDNLTRSASVALTTRHMFNTTFGFDGLICKHPAGKVLTASNAKLSVSSPVLVEASINGQSVVGSLLSGTGNAPCQKVNAVIAASLATKLKVSGKRVVIVPLTCQTNAIPGGVTPQILLSAIANQTKRTSV